MARTYRYLDPAQVVERFIPTLEGLELEHYMAVLNLQVLQRAPGESDESFNQRREALEARISGLERSLADMEMRLGPELVAAIEARAQQRRGASDRG